MYRKIYIFMSKTATLLSFHNTVFAICMCILYIHIYHLCILYRKAQFEIFNNETSKYTVEHQININQTIPISINDPLSPPLIG